MTPYLESLLWEWTNCGLRIDAWRAIISAGMLFGQGFIIGWLVAVLVSPWERRGGND